ncbi:hypothetical protein [Burkholderia sp. Ax-1724]|uniref:hypothetical protein n=1 Tax=Burkholderia sp. Ax-1724 TaxID=2608336 RepID=UPI0014231D67|nr:hypothetical protein [Burkholderia sp. Ax-1724]NIF52067.1 hypothetical protein [Burkholderia sp. Ax-1724]
MSRYAGSFGLSTFFLLAVCIVAIIVVISTFRALCFIFSGQNDRMQRAKQMLRVSTRRTLISVVAVSATGRLWSDGQRTYEPARLSGRSIAPLNGRLIKAT